MMYLGTAGGKESWEHDGQKYQFAWLHAEGGYKYGWVSKRALREENSGILSDERGEWIESFRSADYRPLKRQKHGQR